jgi:hypothetical protein
MRLSHQPLGSFLRNTADKKIGTDMQMIAAILLALISITLFLAWRKRKISNDTLNALAGIFTIVAGLAAITLFVIPSAQPSISDKTNSIYDIVTPTETDYACPDRLSNDVSAGNDDQSRLRPPYNVQVTYRASVNIPGRILAEIDWVHSDARHVSSLIKISGRRGTPSVYDIPVRTNEPMPIEGKCGIWYRQVRDKGAFGGDVIEGLWANETYCFSVNDSDEDGGNSLPYPSIATAPVCQKAEWSKAWGEPATPSP